MKTDPHAERQGRHRRTGWPVVSLLVVLLLAGSPTWAASPRAKAGTEAEESGISLSKIGASTLDVALLRPLGAVGSAVGFGFFAVTTPFLLPSRNFGDSWEIFVEGPVDYTFLRPIGDL